MTKIKKSYKFLLCTQGSQGVELVRQIFSLGFSVKDIYCVTLPKNNKNNLFIDFLDWNKIDYLCSENKEYQSSLIDIDIDYIISVSWRDIFSQKFLNIPKKGSLNFHPGILPDYRGCYSVSWAIINEEEYVGYTWHKISKDIDGGEILYQGKIPILNRNAHTLHYKLFKDGIDSLSQALEKLENNDIIVNDIKKGHYYPNALPYNGIINENWSDDQIEKFIRAMFFPPFKSAVLVEDNIEKIIDTYNDYINYKNQ